MIVDCPFQNLHQDPVVHRIEELLDVELESPARPRVVLTYLAGKRLKPVDRGVCPLPDSAGVTVEDKRTVKEWIQHQVHGMVHESVTDCCFMNYAVLGVEDVEPVIRIMTISTFNKLAVERKDVVL